jgi:hypothetical protein
MKRWFPLIVGLLVAGAVAVPALAQAQQPANPQPPTMGRGGLGMGGMRLGAGLMVCSTSNPTDAAAEALGMSASDLRVALVSGKTLTELATSKNVDVQAIRDALVAQRQADLDQALADGLITQAQHDAITQVLKNAPQGNRLNISVPDHNIANREAAAAEALGMSCADLVKAQLGGESVAQVAAGKNVQVQTVIDAVTKAYTDALAQDVKEGLITQAEADGQTTRLGSAISLWVNGTRRGGLDGFGFNAPNGFNGPQGGFGFGRPFGQGGFGQGGFGFGQRGGMGNRGGQSAPGSQPTTPSTPEATETPKV